MSAFIVSHDHIDALLTFASRIIEAIRIAAVRAVPGIDDAPWEIKRANMVRVI